MNSSYKDYYLTPILSNQTGIKPVRGATGLGKTYGLVQAIKATLIVGKPLRKFVYATNRHALIKEVIKDLEKEGITSYVYLKSDKEVLLSLLGKNLENIVNNLVDSDFFLYDDHYKGKNKEEIKKELAKKMANITQLKRIDIDRDNDESDENYLDSALLKFSFLLKKQFYAYKKHSAKKYKAFLLNPNIWQLFPYIQFEYDPNTTILLGTIQKLCYGFFDGNKKQRLPIFENKVIFLDEFDFLEAEILQILAKDTSLNNPLEFLKIFFERLPALESKAFWEKNDLLGLKNELSKIHNDVKIAIKEHKYQYPTITDFVFSDKKFDNRNLVFFQSTHQIPSEKFYLLQQKNVFAITSRRNKYTIEPKPFFKMIRLAIRQIIEILSISMQQKPDITESIIYKIWNIKNDNEVGAYQRYIENAVTYKGMEPNNAQNSTEFSYSNGFSIIKIEHDNILDDLDADLQQIELNISPEAIIQKLAANNLVFALSATSDMRRTVNCFSEKWLSQNTNFIAPTEADNALMLAIKQTKDNIRQSKVAFSKIKPLADGDKMVKYLKDLGTFWDNGQETYEDTRKNRQERVFKTLSCIDWILQKSTNRSHLVFLTSFDHVKKILTGQISEHIQAELNHILQVENIYEGLGIKLTWKDKSCNILFFNTKKAIEIEENGDNDYFSAMNDETVDKVILITQYATASNGVNLGYKDKAGITRDFEGVHLIENKYYWFSPPENKKEIAAYKQIYWYLWKLWDAQQIGRSQFRGYLQQENLGFVNTKYQAVPEYIINSMALFHQAIGRIERQRTYEQPLVEITLGEDVFKIFYKFLTDIRYENLKNRELYTATTILQLYKQIDKEIEHSARRVQNMSPQNISTTNREGKQLIEKILTVLENVKKGLYNDKQNVAKEVINIWKKIRIYTLEQNYDAEIDVVEKELQQLLGLKTIVFANKFAFSSPFIQPNDTLFMTFPTMEGDEIGFDIYEKNEITIENLHVMDLNLPFKKLKENKTVSAFFENEGYETCYKIQEESSKNAFTPYIQQAILKGAIGEEAIKALLEAHSIYTDELDEIDIQLFEEADAKVRGLPIYLDAKNFSSHSIEKFILTENDPAYDGSFDAYKLAKKIVGKIEKIKKITQEEKVKFVIINFYASQSYKNQYFTLKGKTLEPSNHYNECDIAVIPSTLSLKNPNKLHRGFRDFITFTQQQLSK